MSDTHTQTNRIKTILHKGGTAWGTMAFEFFTPGLCETLAAAGADFVFLDMEHSGIGIETIKAQCIFARGAGIAPLVRVPTCERYLVTSVLDAGAAGIMVPMVETEQQAAALASWCRYRPAGTRGLAFGVAHDAYRASAPIAAMAATNDTVMAIPLIESARGIAAADAILAVPGIDLGWLGHYDLSDSLGCVGAFDDPRYVAAEAALRAAATRTGKPLGWLAADPTAARAAVARGYRCLCLGTDVALLRGAFTDALTTARNQ
jgi:2-keto-3-deoxy-L-rhamnonate aldolase RhmA